MSLTRLLLLAALLAPASLHAAAPPPQPLASQIADWIAQLGHDDPDKRQAAFDRLRAAGPHAEDALESATSHRDAQIKRSARALVADMRRGIYPDTPDEVVALVNKYEAAALADKKPIVRKLLAAGPHGCRALLKQFRLEKDDLVRKEIAVAVFDDLPRAAPALAEFNDLWAIEDLLALAVLADVRLGGPPFAAFHLLAGSLPRQIARLERQPSRREHELLAYLHRANGELDRAIAAAKKAQHSDLVAALLFEKGDWKALDPFSLLRGSDELPRDLGLFAAQARLAGNHKSFHVALEKLLDPKLVTKNNAHAISKSLFLNGRPDDAVAVLEKAGAHPRLRYETLAVRWKLAEASAVVAQAKKDGSAELPRLELAHARTLFDLGEKDESLKILKRYTDLIQPDLEATWQPDLVAAELAIGRREQALAVAAKVMKSSNDPVVNANVFDRLFGAGAEEAALLWVLLRRPPGKLDPSEALAKVSDLLVGSATKEDVERLMTAADRAPFGTPAEQQTAAWIAAGDAADRAGHGDLAIDCFREAKSPPATLRLGDLAAKKGKWLMASTFYFQSFREGIKELAQDKVGFGIAREVQPALALYLYGHALGNLGLESDSQRRTTQAHLLPLGNSYVRHHLARELQKRGHHEAAAREHLHLRRLCEPMLLNPHAATSEGFRAAGSELAKKQPLKAADEFEKAFLTVLRSEVNFAREMAHVTVPAYVMRLRALGLAKEGKYDESVREARRCLEVLPGDVDLARQLVLILEQGDRKKDADELFESTKAVYETIVKGHPKAALAYNRLAWLAATCRRDLDRGLAVARKAVELAPDNADYYDTLAEVLFQSGKKTEALEAQKKAMKLAPKRKDLEKQLKRIEAGDPRAPREEK